MRRPYRKPDVTSQLPGRSVSAPEDPIVVGHIARPVGIGGEVKVYVESRDPRRLVGVKRITVSINGGYRSFKVLSVRRMGGWFQLRLEGIHSPEEAAIFSGAEIVIPSSERPALSEDEYYIDDIIGCLVVSEGSDELGFVKEVISQEHHDLWVIESAAGEVLVPAIGEFIREVDLSRHRIVIKWVDGLQED